MAYVGINTVVMRDLISKLKGDIADIPPVVSRLNQSLSGVWLSCDGLSRWSYSGQTIWRLTQIIADCQRRLDFAEERLIHDQMAGLPTSPVVWFDDVLLTAPDAERVALLVSEWEDRPLLGEGSHGDIPQELFDIFMRNAGNPDFARRLAESLDPGTLAVLLSLMNNERARISVKTPGSVPTFDQQYSRLLAMIGGCLSQAAQNMDIPSLEAFNQKWSSFIVDQLQGSPGAQLLSLVIGRGVWPNSFLDSMADAIERCEARWMSGVGGHDAVPHSPIDWWCVGLMSPVVDPDINPITGKHDIIQDPMGGVWRAGMANPEWFVSRYGGGERVTYTIDTESAIDVDVTVDAGLAAAMDPMERGLDAVSMQWFVQASVMATVAEVEGSSTLLPDLGAISGYGLRNDRKWEELPFWDKYKHIILPLASLAVLAIPVAGPYISTGLMLVDSGLYFYEGDPRAGTISLVLAVLPVAVGQFAARWSTITFSPAELSALNAGRPILFGNSILRVVDGKLTATFFRSDIAEHMAEVETINARQGVVGGHNMANFEQAFQNLGVRLDDVILAKTEIYPGIYEISYQVPLQERGTLKQPLSWRVIRPPKTVYDSVMYSDAQMLQWGREAMANATLKANTTDIYVGVAHGIKFEARLENGIFTNLHPAK